MSFTKTVVIACLLVLPGALLRAGPHIDRLRSSAIVKAPVREFAAQRTVTVSSQMSERSIAILALGMLAELAMHGALLVIILRNLAVASLLHALPLSLRVFAVGVFVALVSGAIGGTRSTFPFHAWRMYSGEHRDVPTACRLTGITSTGAAREIDVEEAVPALGNHRLEQILLGLCAADISRESSGALNATLRALGRAENIRRPADPLRQLTLELVHVPLDADRLPSLVQRRAAATVQLE